MQPEKALTLLVIVFLALAHMAIALLSIVVSSGASWHFFETGESSWWVGPLSWFAQLLLYPALFWINSSFPTFGDIPLWDGVARDYFGGILDYLIIFANSMLWATLGWGIWRFSRRRPRSGNQLPVPQD